MIFFYDIPILMGSLHFEIRLEADAVDKELLFAKTGSVFPASLHGFLGSTYVGKMWSVILHGFWAFWAIGLIGVSCSLSLKLHGHLLSVFFFFGDTSFGPLRFGGYIPPNWCQLKVNSLTNELNAGPEFQRSRLRKTQKMCYLLAAPRTSLDGPARDILEKWPISRGQASGRCSFKKQKKTHVAMASRTAERLAASLPAKWSLEEKITGTANSRAGPGSADLIHHGFPWGVYLILGARDF